MDSTGFRYAFKLGRTDDLGRISASFADLEKMRRTNAEANLMDYNTSLDTCDPTVKLVVPSEAELRKQYDSAVRFYGRPPVWAVVGPWPANARVEAAETLLQLTHEVNRIELFVNPELEVGSA